MKKNSKLLGNLGENIARDFLKSKGYNILQTNFHSAYGEIDIIAQEKELIIFVEIKTRSSNFTTCLNSISRRKQKKIIRTALIFIENNQKYEDFEFRFDVIAITVRNGKSNLLHLKDAFSPSDIDIYSN